MALLTASACRSAPSRADAERWVVELATTRDAVDLAVMEGLAALPRYKGVIPKCDALPPGEDISRCLEELSEWYRAEAEASVGFDSAVLAPLLEAHPSLVGVDVTFTDPARPGEVHSLGSVGNCGGPNKVGSVSPESGFHLDGRDYGWGLGQTSVSFGDDGRSFGSSDYAPMLHSVKRTTLGSEEITLRVVLLAEGTTDAAWRNAWRERVAADS